VTWDDDAHENEEIVKTVSMIMLWRVLDEWGLEKNLLNNFIDFAIPVYRDSMARCDGHTMVPGSALPVYFCMQNVVGRAPDVTVWRIPGLHVDTTDGRT
jgi:hypothetical protein